MYRFVSRRAVFVLYCLELCVVLGMGYEFTKDSCENMLPVVNGPRVMPANTDAQKTDAYKHPTIADELTNMPGTTPFRITLGAVKYRKDRVMAVKVDGDEFNALLLQARQFVSHQNPPAVIGTFSETGKGLATLDCGLGPGFMVANSLYTNDTSLKRSVQAKWRAPSTDMGSIEFVATIVRGNEFWSFVRSAPLLFNEFPPSLETCGRDQSCFRYTTLGSSCDSAPCEDVVVSKVVGDDVIFTIGGRIPGDTGYLGIGFTKDKEKLSFLDLCLCIKRGPAEVSAAHYMLTKAEGRPVKKHESSKGLLGKVTSWFRRQQVMEDEETDIDGAHIWCRFRRGLAIPDSESVDLTNSNLFKVFVWGSLDEHTHDPILPKKDDIIRVAGAWNYTQTVNVFHIVGGAAQLNRLSWTIAFAMLLATVYELYAI